MRTKLCFMAGIVGIAVVAGLLEGLSAPKNNEKGKGETATEPEEERRQ